MFGRYMKFMYTLMLKKKFYFNDKEQIIGVILEEV